MKTSQVRGLVWLRSVSPGVKPGAKADPPQGVRPHQAGRQGQARKLHSDLDAGIRTPASRYTVGQAVEDWLREGLDGRSERVIRHPEANDYVRRNVAALVKPPTGQAGRPSRSLTLEQAASLLNARRCLLLQCGVATLRDVLTRLLVSTGATGCLEPCGFAGWSELGRRGRPRLRHRALTCRPLRGRIGLG